MLFGAQFCIPIWSSIPSPYHPHPSTHTRPSHNTQAVLKLSQAPPACCPFKERHNCGHLSRGSALGARISPSPGSLCPLMGGGVDIPSPFLFLESFVSFLIFGMCPPPQTPSVLPDENPPLSILHLALLMLNSLLPCKVSFSNSCPWVPGSVLGAAQR